jgi:Domain of unknown function (DUF1932)
LYNLERMMVHGKRRAAEMNEVAANFGQPGVWLRRSQAIGQLQGPIGDLGLDGGPGDMGERADQSLSLLGGPG